MDIKYFGCKIFSTYIYIMDFLDDLENGAFVKPPTEKEIKETEKINMKEEKKRDQERKKLEKIMMKQPIVVQRNKEEVDEEPTNGVDKIRLQIRIKKYLELFPDECKDFKIKKNPTKEQLEEHIKELEILSESGGLDTFMNDMIFECIKGAEQLSSYTENFNVSGLSMLLKSNKKFNKLCKQLQLKYNLFVNVPIEIQLVLIISTTSVLCINKNKNKKQLEEYLDEEIKV